MADATPQPHGLIQLLLDSHAPFGDRDDAALDLSAFDGVEVEMALARVASDPLEDCDLAQTSAESLAEIWCRLNRVDWPTLAGLTPGGKEMAAAVLLAANPELKDIIAARLGGAPHSQDTSPRPRKENN